MLGMVALGHQWRLKTSEWWFLKDQDIYDLKVFLHKLFIMDQGENSDFSVIKSNINTFTAILFSPRHLHHIWSNYPPRPPTVTPAWSPQRALPAKQGRPPGAEDNCQHGTRRQAVWGFRQALGGHGHSTRKIPLGSRRTCSSIGCESSAHHICISVAHLGQACLFIDVASPIHLSSVEA